jgi:hypothetical protein
LNWYIPEYENAPIPDVPLKNCTIMLLVVASRLILMSSEKDDPDPLVAKNRLCSPMDVALSGLYHKHIDSDLSNVMVGILRYCALALALATPFGCAKNATLCRSGMLPACNTTEPVLVSGPVTPEASARKALGWKG